MNRPTPAVSRSVNIKLRQLQYFLKVADELHFTRAADRLAVSQPTLSHQIAQLEEDVGTPLFNRVGKTISLTEAGTVYAEYVRSALSQLEAGQLAVSELEGLSRGTLRIGIIQSLSRSFLPAILGEFMRSYPSIRCEVSEMTASAIETALKQHRLDIGFAFAPTTAEKIEVEPVLDEELKLVVSLGHKFAGRRRVRMAELHREPIALLDSSFSTRALIESFLRKAHANPAITFEANSWDIVIGVVIFGIAATIIPNAAIPPHARDLVKVISLRDPTPVRTSALLWPPGTYRTIAARTLAAMVQKRLTRE